MGRRAARRFALALCVLLGLAQCTRSLYGYMYRSADALLLRRIDNYLNLNGEQEDMTRERLRRLHTWHRRTELPAYAKVLRQIAQKSQDGLDEQEVAWIFAQTKQFEHRIYRSTRKDTIDLLRSLTDAQLAHLEKSLEKSNDDLARDVARPAARRLDRRIEKAIENAEDWVGSLDDEQKRRITELVSQMPDTAPVRLRFRRDKQREFVELLRRKPGAEELNVWFNTRFGYEPSALPDYYRAPAAAAARAYRTFVLNLDGMLTPEQRRTARERLLGLADDMMSWSR